MHQKTLVGRCDTLAQIQKNFAPELDALGSAAQQAEVAAATQSADDADALSAITATLKTLLANELHMHERDIDEDVEFVDLGLDSITGVTWARAINEAFHTSIEATKVYRYPTLMQLSRYVKDEAARLGILPTPAAPIAASVPLSGSSAATEKSNATRQRRSAPRFIVRTQGGSPSRSKAMLT